MLTRREVLGAGAAALVSSAIPVFAEDRRRLVLVVFGGGVRSRDAIGDPKTAPNLARIASEGALLERVRVEKALHQAATLAILTGRFDEKVAPGERASSPTVFEYARKDLGLEEKDAWLVPSGGEAQASWAWSTHKDWGEKVGASVAVDGPFRRAFHALVERFGAPAPDSDRARAALAAMRDLDRDPAGRARAEAAVLDDLAPPDGGPGSGDARAARTARAVLAAHRPTLLALVLTNADVGHTNRDAYLEVIRRNDREVGALWDLIRGDPILAETTSLLLLPEHGRDERPNRLGGLDHGDGSADALEVFAIAAGPAFRKTIIKEAVRAVQICGTACAAIGARATEAEAPPIRSILV